MDNAAFQGTSVGHCHLKNNSNSYTIVFYLSETSHAVLCIFSLKNLILQSINDTSIRKHLGLLSVAYRFDFEIGGDGDISI